MRSVLFVAVVLLVAFQAYAGCPAPGPQQVVFYQDAKFGGNCVVKNTGSYPTSNDLGIGNDSISSIQVGSGAKVYVCSDAWYEGRCEVFTLSDARLSDNPIGNDAISSAKVVPSSASITCEPDDSQVAFFGKANFGLPCEVRGMGEYRHSYQIGLKNDSICSIKVGRRVEALLCRDANFGDPCFLFSGSAPTLAGTRVGNNSVSSARVRPRTVIP